MDTKAMGAPPVAEEAVPLRARAMLSVVSVVPPLIYASMLPNMLFYIQMLDEQAGDAPSTASATKWLGWVIAVYNLTKMVLAPLTGRLTNRWGPQRMLLGVMLLQVVGSVVYIMCQNRWWMIASYLLLGAAATSSTVCRAYVPQISKSSKQRTQLAAVIGACTTIGFIAGPALGALLPACTTSSRLGPAFNGCTGPGWLGVPAGLLAIGFVCMTGGSEAHGAPVAQPTKTSANTADPPDPSAQRRSVTVILVIVAAQFACVLPFAAIESLTAPLCSEAYGWTSREIGILFSSGSVASLVALYFLEMIKNRCFRASEQSFLLITLVIEVTAVACMANWFGTITKVPPSVWQFGAAFLVYYISYAMAQTTVFTYFYSVLYAHPSSNEWIGWVSSAGSLGRWIWPVVSASLYNVSGANVTWLATAGIVLLVGPCMLVLSRPLTKRRVSPVAPVAELLVEPLADQEDIFLKDSIVKDSSDVSTGWESNRAEP